MFNSLKRHFARVSYKTKVQVACANRMTLFFPVGEAKKFSVDICVMEDAVLNASFDDGVDGWQLGNLLADHYMEQAGMPVVTVNG